MIIKSYQVQNNKSNFIKCNFFLFYGENLGLKKDIRKIVLENSLKENLSFRDSFLNGVFTVPGDGCIDYLPLLKILKDNNYNKWLVVEAEQDPKKANPFKYAKIGFNYLTNTLCEIGYVI